MKTIWKYKLQVTDEFILQMPEGARILSKGLQHEWPCMWALVDPDAPLEERRFRTLNTGHTIPAVSLSYIGSYAMRGDTLVFHLFEETNKENNR